MFLNFLSMVLCAYIHSYCRSAALVSHGNNAGRAPVTGEGRMVHNGTAER